MENSYIFNSRKYLSLCLAVFVLFSGWMRVQAQSNICDTSAQSEYIEISKSISELQKQVRLVPKECISDQNKNQLQSLTEANSSVAKLQETWSSQNFNMQSAPIFTDSLGAVLTSVNSISNNLKSSSLNPVCADFLRNENNAQIIGKINEVVTNLAPMAMFATAMFKTLSGVVPWVLVVTTLTATVNIFANIKSKSAMDMEGNGEHRRLVQKTVCEYRKIKKTLEYLYYIEGGRSKVARAASTRKEQEAAAVETFKQANPTLASTVDEYVALKEKINSDLKLISEVRTDFAEFDANTSGSEKSFICAYAFDYLKGDFLLNKLSLQPDSTSNSSTLKEAASINSIIRSRKIALSENQKLVIKSWAAFQKDGDKLEQCLASVANWKSNFNGLLASLQDSRQLQSDKLFARLNADERFVKWVRDTRTLATERQFLDGVLNYMNKQTLPGAAISRADLNQELLGLEKFLVGKSEFAYFMGEKKSLVGEWLENNRKLYEKNEHDFNMSFLALNQTANDIRIKRFELDPKVDRNKVSQEKINARKSNNLENINLNEINPKIDRDGYDNACMKLSNLWNKWKVTVDYFDSIKLFCETISDIKSDDLNDYIKYTCYGNMSISPRDRTISWVQKIESRKMEMESFSKRAQTARAKLTVMGCPIPVNPALASK